MSAILRSNDGQSDVTINFAQATDYDGEAGFESTVSIRAEYWDGDHTHPIAVPIEGLWLSADGLGELRGHVAAWVNQPLDQLIVGQLDGSFDLAHSLGQRLSVTFGARPDTIAHFNPVVSILLVVNTFRSEFHFVTDQSCLAMFLTELGNHLHEPQPGAVKRRALARRS